MTYTSENYPPEWLCPRCRTISSNRVEKGCPTCKALPWWRRVLMRKKEKLYPLRCSRCGAQSMNAAQHECEEGSGDIRLFRDVKAP